MRPVHYKLVTVVAVLIAALFFYLGDTVPALVLLIFGVAADLSGDTKALRLRVEQLEKSSGPAQ